jgi:S-DNA-T family DNA segregation ATPase FtsK/SpoIIIE
MLCQVLPAPSTPNTPGTAGHYARNGDSGIRPAGRPNLAESEASASPAAEPSVVGGSPNTPLSGGIAGAVPAVSNPTPPGTSTYYNSGPLGLVPQNPNEPNVPGRGAALAPSGSPEGATPVGAPADAPPDAPLTVQSEGYGGVDGLSPAWGGVVGEVPAIFTPTAPGTAGYYNRGTLGLSPASPVGGASLVELPAEGIPALPEGLVPTAPAFDAGMVGAESDPSTSLPAPSTPRTPGTSGHYGGSPRPMYPPIGGGIEGEQPGAQQAESAGDPSASLPAPSTPSTPGTSGHYGGDPRPAAPPGSNQGTRPAPLSAKCPVLSSFILAFLRLKRCCLPCGVREHKCD